jgi:renalase
MSGQEELDTAIIGGGMAGMACAVGLGLADREAVVFEQDAHPGGRMSGLRAQGYEFDAGAQYFTVRDPLFRAQVETWLAEQRVAPWHGWVVEVERGDFFNRDPWNVRGPAQHGGPGTAPGPILRRARRPG